MLAVVGTIPDEAFPLSHGPVELCRDHLVMGERQLTVNRGTPALLAALIRAGEVLGLDAPTAYLSGDIGLGHGSRALYAFLEEHLPDQAFSTLCFHYLQPDTDWQHRVFSAARSMRVQPIIIADAGFMYAAKMGGQAHEYDLFTPDVGELAFLADEQAPHPFYTRGFILHEEQNVQELIQRAYRHGNAPEYLLVKGAKDYIAHRGRCVNIIDRPVTEALEAIGGTGDTLTGILTAMIGSGMSIQDAGVIAASTNRLAGQMARPDPATQVIRIIHHIPDALRRVLRQHRIPESIKNR